MSRYLSVEGVVLAVTPYGEADAVITLYTREYGRIDARARSIRSVSAKLRGEASLYQHVRALLVHTVLGYRITDARATAEKRWSPRAHYFGRNLTKFFLSLVRGPEEDPVLWEYVEGMFASATHLPTSKEELLHAKTILLARLGYADATHILTEGEILRIIRANHLWEDVHSLRARSVF
ncbi:MAG: recombination protein O N-terminal domain-containing protein [Patescibacteria group bacterium]